ncbi:MAG: 1-phosphofructokinase family hexose kinase [Thermoguttaceae bacterium]
MHITTLGLTPAWQKIMLFDDVKLDHVNRATEVVWCVSGKNANVGIGVASLLRGDGASVLVTPAGGPRLDDLRREFFDLGVDVRIIETETATRVCTTLIGQRDRCVTELVEEGGSLTNAECEAVLAASRDAVRGADVVVVTGSLVRGLPQTFYCDLVSGVSQTTPIIADIRGEGLLHLLAARSLYLVKPNRHELAMTADALRARGVDVPAGDVVLKDVGAMYEAMIALHRAGAQHILVTDGPRAAFVVLGGGELETISPAAIPLSEQRNPIGCGDAVTAGIAWATAKKFAPLEAVRIGLACAATNLRDILPCRLSSVSSSGSAMPNRSEQV